MTFLEQPWQARADHPGTATRLPRHRGFTGSDPAPTLAEFEQWARAGAITYYIAGGGMGGGRGGQGSSSQITAWVEAHYKSAAIGGETVYLLLQPKS
jgi:hypothetical protein